ncbi:MAG: NAD(P)/FAD-dependent oxidoreductase [Candidatus Bathyarchaeota archaeon]
MQYDVAIVGAGPAGTTAARFLAKKGFKVVLVEKKQVPKEKICGGMLTPRVFERFADLRCKMKDLVVSTSYGACLYPALLKSNLQHTTTSPAVFMVQRKEFDYSLLQMAMDYGAELVTKRVKNLAIKPDATQLLLDDNTTIESKVVIGADGVGSVIAKETGLSPVLDHEKLALCGVSEFEIGKETVEKYMGERRHIHLFFGFDNTLGYAWLFPKRSYVNIGLGGILDKTKDVKGSFSKFVGILKEKKLIPENVQPNNFSAALIPVGGPIEKTYTDRVILCGDAAGFVHPLTGEGIYYAMVSGEIASKVITKAMECGEYTERRLSEYQAAWMEDFGKGLIVDARIQKRIIASFQRISDSGIQRRFGVATRFLELGTKIVDTDDELKEMMIDLCVGEETFNKAVIGKFLSRIPISTSKYISKKIMHKKNR